MYLGYACRWQWQDHPVLEHSACMYRLLLVHTPRQRLDNGHLLQEQGPAENENSGIQQQEALGVNNCEIGTVIALFQLEHVESEYSFHGLPRR